MKMAARPEGVLAPEVDFANAKNVTDAACKLVKYKVLTAMIEPNSGGRKRYFASAEQFEAFKIASMPKKHVEIVFSKSSKSPLVLIGYRSQAWWDKSAREGDDGFVKPVITQATKITYCPGFTADPIKSNTFNRAA